MSVGLVLVSHSRALAEGVAELLGQLTAGSVPVVPAGGLPDGGLGTSPERIGAAIAEADHGEGVVVLADIGSAVLSARVVIAELAEDAGNGGPAVRLADAPFVEGAVAAGVAASTGTDLAGVCSVAEEAWEYRKITP